MSTMTINHGENVISNIVSISIIMKPRYLVNVAQISRYKELEHRTRVYFLAWLTGAISQSVCGRLL